MTLTRIDCDLQYGNQITQGTSGFVAFNPSIKPGSFVVAGTLAMVDSLGSQVACKLGIEHFVNSVLGYFERSDETNSARERGLGAVEIGFKGANDSVYEFGHRLAAGGRLAASMISLIVEDSTASAGRVGEGGAYLIRRGELFGFFGPTKKSNSGILDGLVGTQAKVSVEIASVPIEESDIILVFSQSFEVEDEKKLIPIAKRSINQSLNAGLINADGSSCKNLCKQLAITPAFAMVAWVGPDTIYLQ